MRQTKILIVEDELIVAKDLEFRLQKLEYSILGIATAGIEAIEKAGTLKPDIIIMDILLKGEMDGTEASEIIHNRYDIPVIYLTAYSDDKTLQRAKISGPFGYILKPFNERELLTCIEMGLYRYQMEKKLKESEQWFSTTIESIGDAVIATDRDGSIKVINQIALELTGWEKENAVGRHISEVFHITDENMTFSPKNDDFDLIIREKNLDLKKYNILLSITGKKILIDSRISSIKNDNGEISGVTVIFRDITEKQKNENEIIKLSYMVEQSPNSIIIINIQGFVEYINKKFIQLTGYSREEIIGRNIKDLHLEEITDNEFSNRWERIKSGIIWQGLSKSMKKNYEPFWEQTIISPLVNSNGKIINFAIIKDDITERIKAEEALQKTMQEFADLNQNLDKKIKEEVLKNREKDQILIQQSRLAAMGEMIGNIAHQWRQPLNAIGIIIQNIMGAYEFNKLDIEYLNTAVEKSLQILKHMSQTIDDFRNFFKPNKEKELFSLMETIRKTVSFLMVSFQEYNINIEIKIEKDIKIMGYQNEYNQVILNIINNAKDVIIERKIPDPEIIIKLFEQNNKSAVSIYDNAGGIEENIIEKIFDPYFTTKEKGTGIGLYMSKMIIEKNMGGRLTVRNTKNGVEFLIVI